MGCFSCFPRERKQSTNCFSCFSGEGKKRTMNCFSCFSTEGPADGKKRNMNCFSCFPAQEKTRKMNCFSCFQAHDPTQGKTQNFNCFSCCFPTQAEKDLTQGKRRIRNCFSCCFPTRDKEDSTQNVNCYSCFQAQAEKDSTQKKKQKRKRFSCFPTKDSIERMTRNTNCFSCFSTQDSTHAKGDSTQGKTRKMKCFPCLPTQGKRRSKRLGIKGKCHFIPSITRNNKKRVPVETQERDGVSPKRARNEAKKYKTGFNNQANKNIAAKTFTFKELATATKNFKEECLLGEGGFGRVYKGILEKTGEVVAVKQLNRDGKQGNGEFLVEIMMLSHLSHPHLVNLVGYCADGDQRLLVYEHMSAGSLENHLLDLLPGKQSLDWSTRIKVALHAAKGLEYLHETNNPPIIYRDLKSSNILLDKDFNAKLSDFGLAKLGPVGDKTHVTSRVMGTLGYCAPEYQKTGKLTVKSDIYSYGVVLLELVTGRRAVDLTRKSEELHLVRWAEPRIKDPRKYSELVDPLLEGNYPRADLSQVLAIAAMCLSVDASVRPSSSDVVEALATLVEDPVP